MFGLAVSFLLCVGAQSLFPEKELQMRSDTNAYLTKAGYNSDREGIGAALNAAFRDNNEALLYVALSAISQTRTFSEYTDMLYDNFMQHRDDAFRRAISLSVLGLVLMVPNRHWHAAALLGFDQAIREIDGADHCEFGARYSMCKLVAHKNSFNTCVYATRFLLSRDKNGLYPSVEVEACTELTDNCWATISPEVAFVIYSLRKDDKCFAPYSTSFHERAKAYLDGTIKPTPDLHEKALARLDEEIEKDKDTLKELADKEQEEVLKAAPAK